jgi:hypothetical protein
MKSRLKNIILALKERMLAEDSYERSMRQSLARKPFLKTDGRYISREEARFRPGLR